MINISARLVMSDEQHMAASSSRSGAKSEFQLWREKRDISPDRNVVWSELKRSVPVLYYLSRNGHLDHPHFMEVPLSSPPSLFLRDVIDRLNVLRGKGMASMYSWSCKRSYKNGYVWHDLSENDLIYAAHGHEYILKGSELPPENQTGGRRRRNQSCSSIELEYNVEKHESSTKAAADVSTQTDDYRAEIEVSTPPSESSPDTLGTLMKAESSRSQCHRHHHHYHHQNQRCSSSVLMQLISCGSISMPFKDCGAGGGIGKVKDRDYFSGSLVETKKGEIPSLKRSNSYTADRSLNLELAEKEIERLKAKCIPTKIKAHSSTRKEGPAPILQ